MGKKARHLKKFLTKNELAYRTCILYESMHGKPAQEVYDKMQKVFPKRDYYTFQYWYFRFLNGNYDLNHDPSLDPKNPDATLPKMPINVMEKIVDCLDLVDTLSTGKVCRELRDKVDKVNKMFDEVEVRFKLDHVIVETRRQSIAYRSNQNGGACLTVKRRKCDKEVHKECKKTLEECDYLEMAICFKNPNFKGCYLSSNVYQYLPEQEYPVFLVERVMPDQTFYDIITGKYWDWHSTQDLFNITATEVKCGPHRMLEYVELRIERIRNQNS
ncbi:hypothetical protein CAEBREN_18962 [Caenorhabditis brenneri]|uniref:F-box domain-containing protein n=1 Tax=Caenorhabditis brenneri TaxID=135651 RepID=G0NII2_CAEBE|nr:hypothetical protein CAEBREN_18962 [Caenorhabditis brenneri]